jgi:hypothetical protein
MSLRIRMIKEFLNELFNYGLNNVSSSRPSIQAIGCILIRYYAINNFPLQSAYAIFALTLCHGLQK